ncbi:MAG: alpha/beta fold hydrolase [Candidatus Eremiobacteraeota bacterium]|nr:alpha/beta fold hydrolase [Candidatus Eremiobacteraeota bacterium]
MQRKTFVTACAATSTLAFRPLCASAADVEYDLTTPTGTIAGTLLAPNRSGRLPVALIVAGSGPTDRNRNSPILALNIYAKLASALAESGIATVRYDKRGIAASSAAMPSEKDIRFDQYVDDVVAWVAKLRADGRFSSVTLVGHSEGSLVGMCAAAKTTVDGYGSLEGAGFPANEVLTRQLAERLAPLPDLKAQADRILASLTRGTPVAEADVPPLLQSLFRPSVQPYLMSWFAYDPRVQIARASGRITIVQGTNDVQVSVEDGRALAAARPQAAFVLIDGMTHVLVDDPGTTLADQLKGAYADPLRPLDARLVRTLVTAASA